jgi:hypothetical protein
VQTALSRRVAVLVSETETQAPIPLPVSTVALAPIFIAMALPLAAKDWLQPGATALAALVAISGVIISTAIQRRTGRETVKQATRSADAADRASKAADKSADAAQVSATSSDRPSKASERSVEVTEKIAEEVGRRAQADALAKRYQDAAAQLGHEKAPVRFAGVYALARLACKHSGASPFLSPRAAGGPTRRRSSSASCPSGL